MKNSWGSSDIKIENFGSGHDYVIDQRLVQRPSTTINDDDLDRATENKFRSIIRTTDVLHLIDFNI